MIAAEMGRMEDVRTAIEENLAAYIKRNALGSLYAPNAYIVGLGGKRVRPSLLVLAAESFGGNIDDVMPAALAIELFHNFTLMHDDIMDNAPLRRGKATVHEKWGTNTGILSGDALLVQAYQELAKTNTENFSSIFELFNTTALEVCEGQQLDMEFENRDDVSVAEYIEMIRLKTSVLVAAALKIGALLGGADDKSADLLYQFGEFTGLAFQLRDDYLDAFGDENKVGKKPGGDILANKKTFLMLNLLESLSPQDKLLFNGLKGQPNQVSETIELYRKYNVEEAVLREIEDYASKGDEALKKLSAAQIDVIPFQVVSKLLLDREF